VRSFSPRIARLVCLLWLVCGIIPAGISSGAEIEFKLRLLAFDGGYWLNTLATLATADPAVHHRSKVESPKDSTP
jgi:hypothetical protein